jgi:hypothetical protein
MRTEITVTAPLSSPLSEIIILGENGFNVFAEVTGRARSFGVKSSLAIGVGRQRHAACCRVVAWLGFGRDVRQRSEGTALNRESMCKSWR